MSAHVLPHVQSGMVLDMPPPVAPSPLDLMLRYPRVQGSRVDKRPGQVRRHHFGWCPGGAMCRSRSIDTRDDLWSGLDGGCRHVRSGRCARKTSEGKVEPKMARKEGGYRGVEGEPAR